MGRRAKGVWDTHTMEFFFCHKEKESYAVYRKMDTTGNNHIKSIKAVSKTDSLRFLPFVAPRF